jgi:hypothetical protein
VRITRGRGCSRHADRGHRAAVLRLGAKSVLAPSFERAARKHWGKCASFVTSALDPLKTNVCSHTVRVVVSYPSPTSRTRRRFGVWRGGRSGFVRALVRPLIARAMALGRPGLMGWTRELAEGGLRARSSVPSKARRTLVAMNRTPHLERLAAPAKAVSRAGLVRRLRAHLARSPRARLAGSLRARLARVRSSPPYDRGARCSQQPGKTHLSPSHSPPRIPNTWDQQNHPMQHPNSFA